MIALDSIHHTDLLSLCATLDAASIDAIICDLPYGTTSCSWDEIIPFEPMWAAFKRVIKPRGAIVLTASQPFTSKLVMSNLAMFRYEWVWEKDNGSNPTLTDYQPFKVHESALVFSRESATYYPQLVRGKPYVAMAGGSNRATIDYDLSGYVTDNKGTRVPRSVIKFNLERGYHPTQKPVDLFRYLIRTYTQPGDTVLDPCVGSGTTAVAARAEGRHYIVGDTSAEYIAITRDRLRMPFEPRAVKAENDVSELPLFQAVQP